MANFSKLYITDKGKALIAKNYAGLATIEFLEMQTSSQAYSPEDIPALTALANVEQTSLISLKEIFNYCQIKVQAPFNNVGLETGYYIRCLGLIAIDPDEGEILYAVALELSGNFYMAAENENVSSGFVPTLIATVGTSYDVNLEINPEAVPTMEAVQTVDNKIVNHANLTVLNEDGVHGIRYHENKIQVFTGEDWEDAGGKGLLPVLKVSVTSGSVVTCSNGSITVTGTAVNGVCSLDLPAYGDWNVYGTLDGHNSDTVTVTVTAVQEYTCSLSYFSASLLVTAKSGATVTLTKPNGTTETKTSTGTVTFGLSATGNYIVVASYDGATTATKTVTVVQETTSYSETLTFITLTVTVDSGSSVTVSKGSVTKQATSTGTAVFYLPSTGTWAVTATLNGNTSTGSVAVSSYAAYTLKLAYYRYFGLKIAISNSDPATALTYIGDAEGMSAGWDNWKDTAIFSGIRPCLVKNGVVQYYLNPDNFAYKADGTAATINSTSAGDVMIEIPKVGYKMTTDGTYHYIYLTDDPNADGYCYRAHSLDTENDCDYIYIGAYDGYVSSNKLYSISGQTITVSTTLTNFRTYAQGRGTGYQLFSFYPLTLLQCMFLMIYKNRNSQKALGYGYVGGSAKIKTGVANAKGMNYGSTSSQTDSAGMCFLGIEHFWGNVYQWIDGIYSDSSRNILTAFKDFSDTGSGYLYSKASGVSSNIGNYMSDVVGTNEGGFVPKAVNGSSSTYYADNAYLSAGGCAGFGGGWADGDSAGAFRLIVGTAASRSDSNLGARLMYKHKAA